MILMAMIEGGEQYEYTVLLVTDTVGALALCRGPRQSKRLIAPAFVTLCLLGRGAPHLSQDDSGIDPVE